MTLLLFNYYQKYYIDDIDIYLKSLKEVTSEHTNKIINSNNNHNIQRQQKNKYLESKELKGGDISDLIFDISK